MRFAAHSSQGYGMFIVAVMIIYVDASDEWTPYMSMGCRLTRKGLKVLVERNVHTREFPEFDCFDPLQNGRALALACNCVATVSTKAPVNLMHPKTMSKTATTHLYVHILYAVALRLGCFL